MPNFPHETLLMLGFSVLWITNFLTAPASFILLLFPAPNKPMPSTYYSMSVWCLFVWAGAGQGQLPKPLSSSSAGRGRAGAGATPAHWIIELFSL